MRVGGLWHTLGCMGTRRSYRRESVGLSQGGMGVHHTVMGLQEEFSNTLLVPRPVSRMDPLGDTGISPCRYGVQNTPMVICSCDTSSILRQRIWTCDPGIIIGLFFLGLLVLLDTI